MRSGLFLAGWCTVVMEVNTTEIQHSVASPPQIAYSFAIEPGLLEILACNLHAAQDTAWWAAQPALSAPSMAVIELIVLSSVSC